MAKRARAVGRGVLDAPAPGPPRPPAAGGGKSKTQADATAPAVGAEQPPRLRGGLSEPDAAVWAALARGVAPLRGRPRPPLPPAPDPGPVDRGAVPFGPPAGRVAPERTPPRVPLSIGGAPDGVDRATWRRFQGGKLATARKLDLHGMTLQRAHSALAHFLRAAQAERLRCVEVVTGLGSADGAGAIRREFPHWLNAADVRPLVLAASHPHAANPGSVRILLRRVR